MKNKRLLSAAITIVLAVCCIFGGCNQGGNEQSSSAPAESSQVTSQQPSEVSAADESDAASGKEPAQESSEKTEGGSSEEASQESSEEASAGSTGGITPRIYEITDDEGHKLYTMGTIHIADASVLNMPGYFETAFAESDALAVECNSSDDGLDVLSITKLMYSDGSKITDHVSAEDYNKVVKIVSTSPLYNSIYVFTKPMMWVALAENVVGQSIGLDPSYGVDQLLIKKAASEGKEILEVEGNQFQLDLLANMPEEIQNYLFHNMAQTDNYMEENGKALRQMYESWKKGEELIDEPEETDSYSESEIELLKEYYRIMHTDRNLGMADKAEEYLASGKTVFMAVGSAHFYGSGGIYALMEQRGYHIRQLTAEDAKPMTSAPAESEVSLVSETDPGVPRAA